jgi:hypothetical protein
MTWQHISPEMTVEGFKKCYLSSEMDGASHNILWSSSEEDGNVRVVVRKMKVRTVKMETVTVTDW